MGKTNMTELANWMSRHMRNGYSSRGGQVINPYNPEGDVWGSSSGSGNGAGATAQGRLSAALRVYLAPTGLLYRGRGR